jgi:hypothetical protein
MKDLLEAGRAISAANETRLMAGMKAIHECLKEGGTHPADCMGQCLQEDGDEPAADSDVQESLRVASLEVAKLRDAAMSYDQVQCEVRDEISELFPGADIWLQDVYPDHAVFQLSYYPSPLATFAASGMYPPGLYSVDYTIDDAGEAHLANLVPVQKQITYVPTQSEPGSESDYAEAATGATTATVTDADGLGAGDYAYAPHAQKSGSWKLKLTKTAGGDPDPGLVGAAAAALGAGFRGQKVEIPEADLSAVKAKVRAAWKKANPDKDPADMPEGIKESALDELDSDLLPLVEAVIGRDGVMPIKIIAPGWGSSGYYSEEVLKRDGPRVFSEGLHMFLDHPTRSEEVERPERSVRDLAAELVTPARWVDDDPHGPGLYAEARVHEPYREFLADLAPNIGTSINAVGKAAPGEAEGKDGRIIQTIEYASSVDFVTTAGAGGLIPLYEAARAAKVHHDGGDVDMEKLQEAEAKLQEAEVARVAAEEKLAEAQAALEAETAEKVKLEEALAATGHITGMGEGEPLPEAKPMDEALQGLEESFREMGLSDDMARIAARGR